MARPKILVADDDALIVDVLAYQLKKEGYEVVVAHDGEAALALAHSAQPDLILLDVMMPKMDGWEVCRELRRTSTVPVLMLTARGEELDRVLGLELGADDYIVKPFSFRELLARVRATLRRVAFEQQRAADQAQEQVVLGSVVIDRRRHVVTRNGQTVPLSPREYDLLLALVDAGGAAVSRDELLDRVWGERWVGTPRTLDVHVRWLREKLEADPSNPQLILTVRGTGYRVAIPGKQP